MQFGADNAFKFIGPNNFAAARQIRAVKAGANTRIEMNTDSNADVETSILVLAQSPGQFSAHDFNL